MKPTHTLTLAFALAAITLSSSAQNLTFGPATTPHSQPIDEIGLVVNDEAITRRQLAQEIEAERRSVPKGLNLPDAELRQQLLERVIMNHILSQIEKRVGLNINDDEVNAAIAQIANRNRLSEKALYAQAKKDTGLDREAFREQIRRTLAQDQMKEGMVGADITISDQQVDDYLAKLAREQGSTMHIQDLLIPLPTGDAKSRAAAVDEKIREVARALQENGQNLGQAAARVSGARFNDLGNLNLAAIPPRFARALAKLGAGDIVESPVVDDDGMHFLKVVAKHNASENYTLSEADVSHILLRTNEGRDDATQKNRIDAIYRELQGGADFASLARRYSEDSQSAAKGGDLGWVSGEELGGELAQAIAKLPDGGISKPIRAPYGYHILLVRGHRQSDKSEDMMRQQIKRSLYNKAIEDAWQQRLQALRREAYVDIR